jgi:tRNA nucleotidyltransferase (CCA-adding enzyme)
MDLWSFLLDNFNCYLLIYWWHFTHIGDLMEIYLVGGAVRDNLLKLNIKERDWVVVGATPQEMLGLGFRKVGRDFPVFLHPKTHEEYALARTERKTGKGYTGFICYADPSVTLEDDLKRRDLTINAIAQTLDGKIIDPYGGRDDLKKRILRHVSPAFIEDPVRILRLARFAARFSNFKVHQDTNKLMQEMLNRGEVDALVPERVWQELSRALGEKAPERFFIVLKNCQVLPRLFPEIAKYFIDIKRILKSVRAITEDSVVSFAALMFSCDKEEVKIFCKKYKVPNDYKDLALLVNKFKESFLKFSKSADGVITLLEQADAYRRPERFQKFLLAYHAVNKKFASVAIIFKLAQQKTKQITITPEILAKTEEKNNLPKILHGKRVQVFRAKI